MTDTTSTPVAVISGASSGIGLETAKALAARGWRIIAMGRDPARSEQALAAITAAGGASGAPAAMVVADLSLMRETDRAAREIASLTDRVDVLINNAGGTSAAREETAEGNEAVFASNHLAPFLLTARLLPLLRHAARADGARPARVLNVSSSGHEVSQGFDWSDLQSLGTFVPVLAYCNAKLANVLFTRELARRLEGSGIASQAIHPGAVATRFYDYGDEAMQEFGRTTELITAEAGADTVIWLASEAEAPVNGAYYAERAPVAPSAQAQDDTAARRLWDESERLIAATLDEPGFRLL